MNAIEVNKLTKVHRLYNSPKDRLHEIISLGGKKFHHEFPALSGVSFNVEKGQTIGVIGQNEFAQFLNLARGSLIFPECLCIRSCTK